eukprot:scaffold9506_cov58-Phaeocystis_antarctica.AAC.1
MRCGLRARYNGLRRYVVEYTLFYITGAGGAERGYSLASPPTRTPPARRSCNLNRNITRL